MDNSYRTFFGMKSEPFRSDLKHNEILKTNELEAVKNRFDYALRLGGAALVTGEIGSSKSPALRYSTEQLHHQALFWNFIARSQQKWEPFKPRTQRPP